MAQLEDFARGRGKSTVDALDDALADYLERTRKPPTLPCLRHVAYEQ